MNLVIIARLNIDLPYQAIANAVSRHIKIQMHDVK